MVDRKAAEDAVQDHQKMVSEVQGLRDTLSFANEKVKLVESQLAEATKEAKQSAADASPQNAKHTIFQSLMKTLDRAKRTFVLMEARLNLLEQSRICPKCKEQSRESQSAETRPQIGVKRAKHD